MSLGLLLDSAPAVNHPLCLFLPFGLAVLFGACPFAVQWFVGLFSACGTSSQEENPASKGELR